MSIKALSKSAIDTRFIKKIKVQDYSKKPIINGVKIIDLNIFNAEDGYFLEIGRLAEKSSLTDFPNFSMTFSPSQTRGFTPKRECRNSVQFISGLKPGVFLNTVIKQISYSVLLPKAIKAWHLHLNQDDVLFVPPESIILAGLFDLRKDSPSKGSSVRTTLGNHKAKLLFIPRGVAHGLANISSSASSVVYLTNQEFNIKKPDEYRLPWDHLGKDFWKPQRG
ncbi:hypothetical protein A2686_01105 [Candidatus Woesebacteria bacterium RIFCSPHIGHO2_01_FULL_38_10]|uniref:dTDP-4-dehydrorhamnose 3,5-epimerase n=1 Tax=Candidatus Woesebacteria bacterium RIFCSPLOWO2_01_FULL_39_10b TaxID=1802517 RepID=A0A1F8B5V4_9BACT|nr:MAG: hypothetical protein A2686_01105 [Candidatus Woesebacteria bacterium RIFCSPHIGHO2_01_FULL_38_10]OGM59401.1 MAG: hypothetical protein A2892_03555 [Candidatus Woesebacteria bacterium RIFCSPLOWO2_01_FULL_39_10b]